MEWNHDERLLHLPIYLLKYAFWCPLMHLSICADSECPNAGTFHSASCHIKERKRKSFSLPKYVSQGTQTCYGTPSLPHGRRGAISASHGTQTVDTPNIEMNPAVKGEKESEWEDLDLDVPVADRVEDADWEFVDV